MKKYQQQNHEDKYFLVNQTVFEQNFKTFILKHGYITPKLNQVYTKNMVGYCMTLKEAKSQLDGFVLAGFLKRGWQMIIFIIAFFGVYIPLCGLFWPSISYWIDKFKRSRLKPLPKEYNNIFDIKLYVYNYMGDRIEFVGKGYRMYMKRPNIIHINGTNYKDKRVAQAFIEFDEHKRLFYNFN